MKDAWTHRPGENNLVIAGCRDGSSWRPLWPVNPWLQGVWWMLHVDPTRTIELSGPMTPKGVALDGTRYQSMLRCPDCLKRSGDVHVVGCGWSIVVPR